MEKPISVQQWTEYLNTKTSGFNCPICGQNHWQTQQDEEGNVCDVEILDHDTLADLNDPSKTDFLGAFNAGLKGETHVPPPSPKRSRPASLLHHVILIRCGHCGWISLFDRAFVEEELDDAGA